MRILMIHPNDVLSPVEPWTRRIRCLAQQLVKNGYQVKIAYFSLLSQDADQRARLLDGYEVIPFSRYPSTIVFLKNTLEFIKLGRWADIIHFQKCQHYASIPAVVAAYLNRKPLHYDWDDWEEMIWYESCGRSLHSKFIGISFKVLERFLPILSDTVSVSSEYLKKLALNFGVKEQHIFSVPVGADLQQFSPEINDSQIKKRYNIPGLLVLCVGQLHGAQYTDLFVRAARIVLHRNPDVTFMIVGEGFMEGTLRQLAQKLNITGKVLFTGAIAHHKIPEYISAADVCVAAFRDTKVTRCKSPLKIVEYLASGKAIVASNVGEVRRMLGGVGILVKPDDPYALAANILRLLADERLRKNLGNFSRRRAESRYNWPASASSLISAYKRLQEKSSKS